MGYGLNIDGRSAFEALIERESDLTRRPYSSYCFLLAMDADAEALRLLSKYARDLDDVTGEAIAFIALVDRIRLDGTFRPNPRWRDQTPRADLGTDLAATYEIFEDRSTRVEDDFGWRSRWRISGRKSVDFARACEVSLADLPCLVIFDAESFRSGGDSGGLIVPVDSYEGRTFELLRSACSNFYDQNHSHALLAGMRDWDTSTVELERLTEQLEHLAQLGSRVKRSRFADDVIGELRRAGVIDDIENLQEVDGVAVRQLDEFLRVTGDVVDRLGGWKAMKVVDRESVLGALGPEPLAALSGLSARTDMPLVMERLNRMYRMAIEKQHGYGKSRIDAAMRYVESAVERVGLAHGQVADARAAVAQEIAAVSRPLFTPFVEAQLKRDRREARRIAVKIRATEASGWLRSIIDAVSSVGSQFPS